MPTLAEIQGLRHTKKLSNHVMDVWKLHRSLDVMGDAKEQAEIEKKNRRKMKIISEMNDAYPTLGNDCWWTIEQDPSSGELPHKCAFKKARSSSTEG